ncbi:MAG: methylmalonyl-CoA mutase family protein [Bacteroidota bacterium]
MLFSEFPAVSKEEWLEKVRSDLKGKSLDRLNWTAEAGVTLPPFFTRSDLSDAGVDVKEKPAVFPFKRGNLFQEDGADWQLIQEIHAYRPEEATARIEEAKIANVGAFSLVGNDGKNLRILLADIDLTQHAIHLDFTEAPILLSSELILTAKRKGVSPRMITGTLHNDPIGAQLNHDPGTPIGLKAIVACEGGLLNCQHLPWFRALGLDMGWVESFGGTQVQQIAFALANTVEYLELFKLVESKLRPEQILHNLAFTFSIGSNFFMEVAKVRAFRSLFALMIKSMGFDQAELQSPFIIGRTSRYEQTIYDPYNNLLRATTQSISAVVGGVNGLIVTAMDRPYALENAQSARLARNIQHMLKHESSLDQVIDPAGGSYLTEILTDQLADEAWKLFQAIEKRGGLRACMDQGLMLQLLSSAKEQETKALARRKKIQIGINQFPNTDESLTTSAIREEERLADEYESLRQLADLYAEKNGRRLQAVLVAFGDLKMRNARTAFARNLLGSGGFAIEEMVLTQSADNMIAALSDQAPQIVVLCAGDENYLAEGNELFDKIRTSLPGAQIVVAGKVESPPADHMIYAGMNALQFLTELLSTFLL